MWEGCYGWVMDAWIVGCTSPSAAGRVPLQLAERELSTSISLNPAVTTTHLNYGVLLEKKGRIEEALSEYRLAIHWAAPQEADKIAPLRRRIAELSAQNSGIKAGRQK